MEVFDEAVELLRSREDLRALSRELPTHFKWLILSDPKAGVSLHLHDYKEPIATSRVHIQLVHNHRYDLASLIWSGGYTNRLYDVTGTTLVTERKVSAGDTWMMRSTQFHSVDEIHAGTFTFVLQSKPQRGTSTVIGLDGSRHAIPDQTTRANSIINPRRQTSGEEM